MLETRTFEAEDRVFRYARICLDDYRRLHERMEKLKESVSEIESIDLMSDVILLAVNRAGGEHTREELERSLSPGMLPRIYGEVMAFTGAERKRADSGEASGP